MGPLQYINCYSAKFLDNWSQVFQFGNIFHKQHLKRDGTCQLSVYSSGLEKYCGGGSGSGGGGGHGGRDDRDDRDGRAALRRAAPCRAAAAAAAAVVVSLLNLQQVGLPI